MNRLRRVNPLQWLVLSGLPLVAVLGAVSLGSVVVHNNSMRSTAAERTSRLSAVAAQLTGRALETCAEAERLARACLAGLDLNGIMHPLGGPAHTIAYVVGPDGRAAAHINPIDVGADMRDRPGVAEVLHGAQGTASNPGEPEARIIAYAPVLVRGALSGYGIVIEEPWEATLDPLIRYSLMVPVLALAALALAGLVVMLTMRAQAQHDRLRTYARALTDAQEAERSRLARELHDGTVQNLVALNQRVQLLRLDAADQAPALVPKIDELRGGTLRLIDEVRRTSHDLRPLYLDELGLAAAFEKMAAEVSAAGARSDPPYGMTFRADQPERRLEPAIELALFRIAQEAVANALRHGRPSRIELELADDDGRVRLSVRDDGAGFDPELVSDGLGLINIRERAAFVGAQATVSSAPGAGTRVDVTFDERGG